MTSESDKYYCCIKILYIQTFVPCHVAYIGNTYYCIRAINVMRPNKGKARLSLAFSASSNRPLSFGRRRWRSIVPPRMETVPEPRRRWIWRGHSSAAAPPAAGGGRRPVKPRSALHLAARPSGKKWATPLRKPTSLLGSPSSSYDTSGTNFVISLVSFSVCIFYSWAQPIMCL